MTDIDPLILQQWHVTEDTLIGGWMVSNSTRTHEELDPERGEVSIASFVTEEQAQHMVDIHNAWLDRCHYELNYHVSPHRGCLLR